MNDTRGLNRKRRLTMVAVSLNVMLGAGARAHPDARYEARKALHRGVETCDRTPTSADPLVLAELQVWHGSGTHTTAFSCPPGVCTRPYDSGDPVVIASQIAAAQAQGIDGFVIDWYGPDAPLDNQGDRALMDAATAKVFDVAEGAGFCLALLYDEGTLRDSGLPLEDYPMQAESDLMYVDGTYFPSSAYLKLAGNSALFVFPYSEVDDDLDWSTLPTVLSREVALLDLNPDPDDPDHDANFDGFFAWVEPGPGGWDLEGQKWGDDYLHWFYATMETAPYADKYTVGGVWPGFDDSLAPWGENRFMSRRGGGVYDATWALATCRGTEIVMIGTWNDFEEGTDVEFGVGMQVDMDNYLAEQPFPEVLIRSWPFEVTWTPVTNEDELQVYHGGVLIFPLPSPPAEYLSPPVTIPSEDVDINIESGKAYEIKVWTTPTTPLVKWVKTRRYDPISDLFFDGFESGDFCLWSASTGALNPGRL